MNKTELVSHYQNFLDLQGLTAEQVTVGAGGALCLLGLREQTADIDVDVDSAVFELLLEQGHPTHRFGESQILVIEVTPMIDAHLCDANDTVMLTDGVAHYTPDAVLSFKRRLNRDKDQADIQVLVKYLAL